MTHNEGSRNWKSNNHNFQPYLVVQHLAIKLITHNICSVVMHLMMFLLIAQAAVITTIIGTILVMSPMLIAATLVWNQWITITLSSCKHQYMNHQALLLGVMYFPSHVAPYLYVPRLHLLHTCNLYHLGYLFNVEKGKQRENTTNNIGFSGNVLSHLRNLWCYPPKTSKNNV